MLAVLIAGILVAGIAVAGVRGSRTTTPQAQPSVIPTETATEASPSVTMTFSGLPPFEQTGTPSPTTSPGERLPQTGSSDRTAPMAALLLALAFGTAALLTRATT